MKFSTIHTHTVFSDGKHNARENIESALSKGMRSIGFSDHSFTACDTSYCMKLEDYPAYVKEIGELKAEYSGRIPVFCGIEKDYYSEIDRGMFEYVIGSVHYIVRGGVCYPIDHTAQQQRTCADEVFSGSLLDMAKCYFEMVAEHTYLARPDVVGHFDVINKFSLMPECDDKFIYIAEEALSECAKWCNIFEVNTGGMARGWRKAPYPNLHLLKLIKDLGAHVMLNSDCHNKDNLDFAYPVALDFIKSAGIDELWYLGDEGFKPEKI